MKGWSQLYIKELHNLYHFILIVASISLLWQLILFMLVSGYFGALRFSSFFMPNFGVSSDMIVFIGLFPLFLLPLMMLVLGYRSFREEWKDDTITFLFTVPKPGWYISLAKFAAALTIFIITILFTILLHILLNGREFINHLEDFQYVSYSQIPNRDLLGLLLIIIVGYLLYGITLYILAQLSYLVSRFYKGGRRLLSFLVFFLSGYLLVRGTFLLKPLFHWVPSYSCQVHSYIDQRVVYSTIYFQTPLLFTATLILVILFFLGSWLLDNHLET